MLEQWVSVVWHQRNLLQGGMVWGGMMAIGCKCTPQQYILQW
jgi:hypothetical protein